MRPTLAPLVCALAASWLLAGNPALAGDAATVLMFDDLPVDSSPGNNWAPIPNGYGGLQWNNFGAIDGSVQQATSHYRIGIISPRNVAFNLSGDPASISRGTGFTLHSAYLTGPFATTHLRVQGLVGATVTYDNTYTISNSAPALIDFNYLGVDRVIFVTSPESPFALDNLAVTVPPPDAACTYVLSPQSRRHDFGAETGVVSVTTQTGCAWSVVNTNDWVTILSSLDNSGSGSVTYAVAAEPTATARRGFISIAGQKFAVSQSVAPPADEVLLTFEDVLPGVIPNGYGGLQWNNFGVIDGSVQQATSHYRIGIISPRNVAFNLSGDPASISRGTGFTLHSAYLTGPFATTHLRVQGLVGTTVTYDNTYTISNSAPALIDFNYLGVDRVIFVTSPESPFALDNLAVTVPPPDAACTYVLSPPSRRHDFGAETGVVSVTTQTGCAWNVVNTNNWVTILSSVANSGSGTVTYAVAAEPTATARNGFISIAGQKFAVSQSVAPPADEVLLTFDDVLPGVIPNGYGGLQWNNFGVLDSSILRETSGYRIGLISPDNVAFNQYGDPVSISSESPFTLKSAYLTRALDVRTGFATMQVRVQGSLGMTVAYDNIYTISNTAPAWIDFNYAGVDRVTFVASPSTQFAVDDLVIIVPMDSDGDGVLDKDDACPGTPPGAVVNEHGCSIEQLVPCAGPARGGTWRNHGQYVATVTKVALSFRRAKLITAHEMAAIVRAAAKSSCGRRTATQPPDHPARR